MVRGPAQRQFALKLYRIIRTLHRALPPEMRTLGDAYARDEFKRHKTAEQKHLIGFFEQWVACTYHYPYPYPTPTVPTLHLTIRIVCK